MKSLLARARFVAHAIGVPGIVAAGVLGFSAVFWVVAVTPAREELARAEERIARLEARARTAPGSAAPPRSGPEALDQFLGSLPSLAQARAQTLALHATATRHDLTLETGEYRLLRDRDGRMLRYQVRLPVKGPYPRVRGFLAEALEQIPAMALDDVAIKRESLDAGIVEARLQFTLFVASAR